MPNQLEQWFFDIPLVTRFYLTGAMALTFLVQIGWIDYLDIYLNYDTIFKNHQYWKFVASFFYLGTFSFDWIWNMYFITKYSRMLEEESFSGRVGDFAWFMVLTAISITISAPILELEVLAPAFTQTMTYIWSRRNPNLQVLLLGAIPLTAPYLPYIFFLLSWLFTTEFPKSHFIAIVIGHVYYFFEDVWPQQPGTDGVRYLKTPRWFLQLIQPDEIEYEAIDAELPLDDEDEVQEQGQEQERQQDQQQQQQQEQRPHQD